MQLFEWLELNLVFNCVAKWKLLVVVNFFFINPVLVPAAFHLKCEMKRFSKIIKSNLISVMHGFR